MTDELLLSAMDEALARCLEWDQEAADELAASQLHLKRSLVLTQEATDLRALMAMLVKAGASRRRLWLVPTRSDHAQILPRRRRARQPH